MFHRFFAFLLMGSFLVVGCVAVPPGGGGALVVNSYTTPHIVFPVVQGSITAEATARCVMSSVCWGNISPYSIAKDHGIEVITSTDYRYFSVFIFFSSTTLIVHGHPGRNNEK